MFTMTYLSALGIVLLSVCLGWYLHKYYGFIGEK